MMSDILFLTIDEIFELHLKQIELFGGGAGLRDCGLLESAVAQPAQAFGGQYLHDDIAAMAAAYLYHIVLNHPFIDGNKRTGADAAVVFLDMNGYELNVGDEQFAELVLSVAQGQTPKSAVAEFIRAHIVSAAF